MEERIYTLSQARDAIAILKGWRIEEFDSRRRAYLNRINTFKVTRRYAPNYSFAEQTETGEAGTSFGYYPDQNLPIYKIDYPPFPDSLNNLLEAWELYLELPLTFVILRDENTGYFFPEDSSGNFDSSFQTYPLVEQAISLAWLQWKLQIKARLLETETL